nr:soluble lamin-associated protein of 75 kDa-like [Oncorhynchus nerka]
MEFPVDVLGSVRHEEEEQAAEGYMTQLRYIIPDKAESFTLPSHRMICISLCNVGLVPIYGGDLKHKILALFAPEDQLTAVALFLAGQWWSVEDILRTSDPSRTGLLKVRSLGERIVLYILNRIVYRVGEIDKPEVPFLCHGQNHFAKLLWKDGHAVGFYSVKPKDSLCNGFVTQRYQLPVMDSIFIRKCHRGNRHGLQMLEDFVDSFKDDQLGLKYPLSLTMYKEQSERIHNPEQSEHIHNPEQSEYIHNPEQSEYIHNPEQSEHILNLEQSEHIHNPEQSEHIHNPEQSEHIHNPEQSEHIHNPEQSEHIHNPEQSEHIHNPEQSESIHNPEQSEYIHNLEHTTQSEHTEPSIPTRTGPTFCT